MQSRRAVGSDRGVEGDFLIARCGRLVGEIVYLHIDFAGHFNAMILRENSCSTILSVPDQFWSRMDRS